MYGRKRKRESYYYRHGKSYGWEALKPSLLLCIVDYLNWAETYCFLRCHPRFVWFECTYVPNIVTALKKWLSSLSPNVPNFGERLSDFLDRTNSILTGSSVCRFLLETGPSGNRAKHFSTQTTWGPKPFDLDVFRVRSRPMELLPIDEYAPLPDCVLAGGAEGFWWKQQIQRFLGGGDELFLRQAVEPSAALKSAPDTRSCFQSFNEFDCSMNQARHRAYMDIESQSGQHDNEYMLFDEESAKMIPPYNLHDIKDTSVALALPVNQPHWRSLNSNLAFAQELDSERSSYANGDQFGHRRAQVGVHRNAGLRTQEIATKDGCPTLVMVGCRKYQQSIFTKLRRYLPEPISRDVLSCVTDEKDLEGFKPQDTLINPLAPSINIDFVTYLNVVWPSQKTDTSFVRSSECTRIFDLPIVKNWFNGQVLHIESLDMLATKRCPAISLVGRNRDDRREKFESRGFTFDD